MSHLFNRKIQVDDPLADAFGRVRVSTPYTINDYSLTKDVDTQFLANTQNGGAVTLNTARASANLTTTSATNSVAIHQSKMYHHYLPGKSQLVIESFNFHGNTANVTKRVGYFDANNGIYLEQTGNGTLNFVLRSSVNASGERRIPQSSWNIDPCDGTGKSKFDLDPTKTQLFITDFQWLGVGRVRCGFVHDGVDIIAHEFYNSNNQEAVYMRSGTLPVRYEILNTGTTTGGVLEQICATVLSEGGYIEAGRDWSAYSNGRSVLAGSELPILAIRLKNVFDSMPNHVTVRLNNVHVFSTADNIRYKVIRLPDLGNLSIGANTWISVANSSAIEYIDTAYAYTDGTTTLTGYVAATSQNLQKPDAGPAAIDIGSSARKNYITQNIESSNSEIYVLVANNIGSSTTTVHASFNWREIY